MSYSYEKFVRRMLMKLTAGVNFTKILRKAFLYKLFWVLDVNLEYDDLKNWDLEFEISKTGS